MPCTAFSQGGRLLARLSDQMRAIWVNGVARPLMVSGTCHCLLRSSTCPHWPLGMQPFTISFNCVQSKTKARPSNTPDVDALVEPSPRSSRQPHSSTAFNQSGQARLPALERHASQTLSWRISDRTRATWVNGWACALMISYLISRLDTCISHSSTWIHWFFSVSARPLCKAIHSRFSTSMSVDSRC